SRASPLFSTVCYHHFVHPPCLPSFPTRRSSDLFDWFAKRSINRSFSNASPSRHLRRCRIGVFQQIDKARPADRRSGNDEGGAMRSEEHTSELQSQSNLVCRLLLEKKKHKTQECV